MEPGKCLGTLGRWLLAPQRDLGDLGRGKVLGGDVGWLQGEACFPGEKLGYSYEVLACPWEMFECFSARRSCSDTQ